MSLEELLAERYLQILQEFRRCRLRRVQRRRRLSQCVMLPDGSEQKQLSTLETLHDETGGRNLPIYHPDALPVISNPISQDDERRLELSSRLLYGIDRESGLSAARKPDANTAHRARTDPEPPKKARKNGRWRKQGWRPRSLLRLRLPFRSPSRLRSAGAFSASSSFWWLSISSTASRYRSRCRRLPANSVCRRPFRASSSVLSSGATPRCKFQAAG